MDDFETIKELETIIAGKEEEIEQLRIREEELRPDLEVHNFKVASERLRLHDQIDAISEDLHKYRQRLADCRHAAHSSSQSHVGQRLAGQRSRV